MVGGALALAGTLTTCDLGQIVTTPPEVTLGIVPAQLADSAPVGSTALHTITAQITTSGPGSIAWQATRARGSAWLILSATDGTVPGIFSITLNPAGLDVGVYHDTIVVSAGAESRDPTKLPVRFTIHPCVVQPVQLVVEVSDTLTARDCSAPHRAGRFAQVYSLNGAANDSVSVHVTASEMDPYVVLAQQSASVPLAEANDCPGASDVACLRYVRLPANGTFLIEVTTAVTADSGAFTLSITPPRAPNLPSGARQRLADQVTTLGTGAEAGDSTVILGAVVTDADPGDSARLEVEIRQAGTAFIDAATGLSSMVGVGDTAWVTVRGLADDRRYHWQFRARDLTGRASAWASFGGNGENEPDFGVSVAQNPGGPADLSQRKSDGVTVVAPGDSTDERTVVFAATVTDPDPADNLRLDVEVQPVGTPFTGIPTGSSVQGIAGATAVVTVAGLADDTEYRWRARTSDQTGRSSDWVAFGGNQDTDADFRVAVPGSPGDPTGLAQFRQDGATALAAGGTSFDGRPVLAANVTDPDPGSRVRLQVEVRPVGTPFNNAATDSSAAVASGVTAVVAVGPLGDDTGYRWQARAVDETGRSSPWVPFGADPSTADFTVAIPATSLSFVVQPRATPSGSPVSPAVQVAAREATGVVDTTFGAAMTIARLDGGALSGATSVNAVRGVATFADLAIVTVGSYRLVVSASGLPAATSDTFSVTPGTGTQLAIVTQPGSQAASGIPFLQQPVLALRDQNANPLPASGVTVTATIATGPAGATLVSETAVTDAGGQAAFSGLALSGPTGSYTLSFSVPGVTPVTATAITLNAGPPSAAQTTAVVGAGTAGVVTVIQVTARDAAGNPVTTGGSTVAVSVSGANTVSPPVTDHGNGTYSASYTPTAAGTDNVAITLAGTAIQGSPYQSVVGPAAARSIAIDDGDGQSATVGTTVGVDPSVIVRDQFGNPVPGVAVTFAATSGGGTVDPTTPVTTGSDGIARVVSWSLGSAAGANTLSATAAGLDGSPVVFTATAMPGAAAAVRFVVQPSDVTAGDAIAPAIQVEIIDALGNRASGSTAAVTVTIGTNPASGTLSGTGTVNAAGGLASFPDLSIDIATTGYTLVASSGSLDSDTSDPFDVSPSTAVGLAFVIEPTNTAAGATVVPAPRVAAVDQFGNIATGYTDPVTVQILEGTGTVGAALLGTTTLAASSGLVEFVDLAVDRAGTAYRLDASSGGLAHATSAPFNVSSGTAARLSFSVEPGNIVAGAVISPAVRVSALDQFGNVVTTFSGTVDLGILAGSGTAGAQILGTSGISASNGVAIFSTVSVDLAGTGYRFRATSPGVPTPDTSAAFSVTPGPATTLTVGGVTDPVTAGGSATLTVTARDAFGNVAAGYTGTVAFTSSDPQATLPSNYTFVAGDAGVRTFGGGVTLRTAGERTVTATDVTSSAITGTQAGITVEPAGAATVSVTGITDPVTAGVPSGVTVTARDPFGNVATGYVGTVQFTSSDDLATLPASYSFAAQDQGVRAFPNGVILRRAGEQSVTATDNVSGTITGSQGTITVQAAAPATLAFTVQPTDAGAGELISPALQITALDAFGNVATGYSGTITVSLTAATGTDGAVLSGDLVENAIGGVATFGTLSINLTGMGYRLDATDSGLPVVTSDPFDVTPGAANHLAFTIQPVTTTAGQIMATVEVSVLDAQNNVVTSATAPVTLARAQGPNATLFGDVFVEPVNGVASFTDLRLEVAGGNYRLSAGASGMTSALSTTFGITPAAPATMTITQGAGQTAEVGTAVATDPAVRVADAFTNPVPNVSVTFTPSGSGSLTGSPALTSPTGTATITSWTLGSTAAANSDTLTASTSGVSAVQFIATATAGAGDTLRAVSSTALAGIAGTQASPTPTVIVVDRFGNPVTGASVTFTPTAGSISPGTPVPTGPTGQASVTWTYGTATGSQSLAASVAGLTGSPVTFSAIVAVPTVTLSVDRATLLENGSDGPAVVTATLSASSGQTVTVNLDLTGSATESADYSASAFAIVIPAGQLAGTASLAAVQDELDEDDETITVDIASVVNGAETGVQREDVTIMDDDAAPTVAFTSAAQTHGESTASVPVTIQLSAVSGRNVTVPFTVTGTATGGGTDYSITPGPLTILAGTTAATATVTVTNDALDEPDETVVLTLGTPTNATLGATTLHTVTITDNDMPPRVTLGTSTAEMSESGGAATLTATLRNPGGQPIQSGFDVTVNLGFTGTATGDGTDYTVTGLPLVIPAGALSAGVSMVTENDLLDEADETAVVDILSVVNGTESQTQQITVTITDDDATPTVAFTAAAQSNLESVTPVTVTVQLSAASGLAVTVPVSVDGASTAADPADYALSATVVTIPAGQTTGTLTLAVVPDALDEADETVVLTLGTPTNATLGATTTHTVTLTDDDAQPTVSFTAAVQSVGEGIGAVTVTVQLSAASGLGVSVPFTVGGTAAGGGTDYSITASPVVITAGATTGTVTLTVMDDALDEADETVVLTLGTPTNATLAAITVHTATITDNDAPPTVSFTAASQTDLESVTSVTATVQLSAPSGLQVTVPFTLAGTATGSGTDYSVTASPVVIAAGATTGTVTLTLVDDALDEADETVLLTLGTPTNAGLGATTVHTLTITDNDGPPTAAFTAAAQSNSEGLGTVTATVQLSEPSGLEVSVPFTLSGTATGGGADYSVTASPVVIAAGATTGTVTLTVVDDALDEADEIIVVTLGNPANATLGTTTVHTATIVDDDVAPTVTLGLDLGSIAENGGVATVTASLSAASGLPVTVDLAFGGSATVNADYIRSATQISIGPGAQTGSITITGVDDAIDEADETVVVDIAAVTNATEVSQQQVMVTISDDEGLPTVSFTSATQSSGEGVASVTATVQLSGASALEVSVPFTVDGTATGGGSDYSVTAGPVVIAAGATTGTVTITVVDDALDETDETVVLTLGTPTNAGVGATTVHTATITDNDPTPTVSFTTAAQSNDEGVAIVTATVQLSAASGLEVSVPFTVGGSATGGGADYAVTAGPVVIAAGATTGTVTITVVDDALDEADETVVLTLGTPTNAGLGATTIHTGTITDDDPTPTLSIDDVTVAERTADTVHALFTVTLSAASGQTVTVNYETANGTATAPEDYAAISTTPLTFAPGETTQQVTVVVEGDALDEPDETFSVNLASPANATIADGTGTGTITDDDATPTLSIDDVTVAERTADTVHAVFTVTLSAASGQTVTVNYETANGTATAPEDYAAISTTPLTFAPGETTQQVTVVVEGDALDEPDETFHVALTGPTNATLAAADTGTGTITDDDDPPVVTLTVDSTVLAENGLGPATVTATLSAVSGLDVTVDLAFVSGTAVLTTDYTRSGTQIVILAGNTTGTITLNAVDNALTEPDKTIVVEIDAVNNGTEATPQQVTVTISDDEGADDANEAPDHPLQLSLSTLRDSLMA